MSMFNRYISPRAGIIWCSDTFLIFSVTIFMSAIRFGFEGSEVASYDPYLTKTIVIAVIYMIVYSYFDLYSPEMFHLRRQMFIKLAEATLVGTIILFSIYFMFPSLKTWRGILLANSIAMPSLLLFFRVIFIRTMSANLPSENVLIIGSGELAKKVGIEIYNKPENGMKLIGFLDDDPAKLGQSIVNPGVIGGYADIRELVMSRNIGRIVVAIQDRRAKLPMSALLDLKLSGIRVEEGETFLEKVTGKIPLDQLKPSWMVFSDGFKLLKRRKALKRVSDVIFSSLLLIIASPIMLITAILIKLDLKGPVIFKQARVGENDKEFEVYKFRSMRQDAEAKSGPVWANANDNRVTRLGRIIRKTRIDELPQLINVIKGEMSFVGPRPERRFFVEQLKKEIPYYETRTAVKPGLTGWAQIKYPYGATVQDALEKLQYDIYYIKNMSPILDMITIFWTVKVVFTGSGAR